MWTILYQRIEKKITIDITTKINVVRNVFYPSRSVLTEILAVHGQSNLKIFDHFGSITPNESVTSMKE